MTDTFIQSKLYCTCISIPPCVLLRPAKETPLWKLQIKFEITANVLTSYRKFFVLYHCCQCAMPIQFREKETGGLQAFGFLKWKWMKDSAIISTHIVFSMQSSKFSVLNFYQCQRKLSCREMWISSHHLCSVFHLSIPLSTLTTSLPSLCITLLLLALSLPCGEYPC